MVSLAFELYAYFKHSIHKHSNVIVTKPCSLFNTALLQKKKQSPTFALHFSIRFQIGFFASVFCISFVLKQKTIILLSKIAYFCLILFFVNIIFVSLSNRFFISLNLFCFASLVSLHFTIFYTFFRARFTSDFFFFSSMLNKQKILFIPFETKQFSL